MRFSRKDQHFYVEKKTKFRQELMFMSAAIILGEDFPHCMWNDKEKNLSIFCKSFLIVFFGSFKMVLYSNFSHFGPILVPSSDFCILFINCHFISHSTHKKWTKRMCIIHNQVRGGYLLSISVYFLVPLLDAPLTLF